MIKYIVVGIVFGLLWAHAEARDPRHGALGGVVVGGVCALVGIALSSALGDVDAVILAFGTVSPAVGGALGGLAGTFLWPRAENRA